MLNTDIAIVCPTGRNRSRFLKEYLKTKGYCSHALGINDKNAERDRKIRNAKVVISAHAEAEAILKERFDMEDKVFICLDVSDQPGPDIAPDNKKISGEEWIRFQQEIVYPTLKRQIDKYLPFKI